MLQTCRGEKAGIEGQNGFARQEGTSAHFGVLGVLAFFTADPFAFGVLGFLAGAFFALTAFTGFSCKNHSPHLHRSLKLRLTWLLIHLP
jgi:hypothetical protein